MSDNMQGGKMFIYFTNLSFTVAAFYFAIGMNLSCITIMQRRDQRYENEDENIERQALASSGDKNVDQSKDFKMSVDKEVTISENVTTEEEPQTQVCAYASPSFASPMIKNNLSKNTRKCKSSIEEEDEDSDHSFSGRSHVVSRKVIRSIIL
jgi:hypothetical protein